MTASSALCMTAEGPLSFCASWSANSVAYSVGAFPGQSSVRESPS
jgi:hypothetical protein